MNDLRMERHFPAPQQKVFDFITRRENLLKWWGPKGTSVAENNLDLSKTGPWFFVMVDPNGGRHKVTGEVLTVDPPNSVSFTLIVHDGKGGTMIDSTVWFRLTPDGQGGTNFVLIQSGLTDEEIELQSTQGWASTLARLEDLLT